MSGRWLCLTAFAFALVHHLGLVPAGLGDAPDGTRWTDWMDLLGRGWSWCRPR